ncbi:uncharacterized protein BDZ99DRAFT_470925 [Mytilinidion resinicola]|uniref:F-box domain-containing protein n=1 Tax=Mytilinidion resinicola TaxID=574789 RepID=A0A6A6ZAX7_9PEZI|nr:uncharacterized protein BDZ99DRAFT_470925 [Mytilinidion resinicola]KAF2817998.1 hypothetical protein BDZ99DRAFT_470925 [Mytilinidion resinicola]
MAQLPSNGAPTSAPKPPDLRTRPFRTIPPHPPRRSNSPPRNTSNNNDRIFVVNMLEKSTTVVFNERIPRPAARGYRSRPPGPFMNAVQQQAPTAHTYSQMIHLRTHLMAIHTYVRRPWLLNCPAELIDLVAKFLSRNDFLSFRTACKDVHQKTLYHLNNSHLLEKKVAMTTNSRAGLASLIELAHYPDFASRIRKVTIHIETSTFVWGTALAPLCDLYGDRKHGYWTQHFNHPRLELEQRSVDLTLLLICLRLLPALDTFEITDLPYDWTLKASSKDDSSAPKESRSITAPHFGRVVPVLTANFCTMCSRAIPDPAGEQCHHFTMMLGALASLACSQAEFYWTTGHYGLPLSSAESLIRGLQGQTFPFPVRAHISGLRVTPFVNTFCSYRLNSLTLQTLAMTGTDLENLLDRYTPSLQRHRLKDCKVLADVCIHAPTTTVGVETLAAVVFGDEISESELKAYHDRDIHGFKRWVEDGRASPEQERSRDLVGWRLEGENVEAGLRSMMQNVRLLLT